MLWPDVINESVEPTGDIPMRAWLCLVSRFVLLLALCVPSLAQETDADFKPLFNGENLDGWQRVNTDESTWSIEDGMLICSGKPTGELRTTRKYQNFILEVEWRHMKPRGNAGIFVWADDITAPGVPFHRSIEVQVLENAYGNTRGYTTHGDIFPIHGAKMEPVNGRGGSRAFPTENRSKPSPEWNHYRIECRDGEISLAVNGKVVTKGKKCSPRKGYICVESEGGVVHYRNMRIKELPATDIEKQHVAISDRGYRCLYTGIDLDGWESVGKWKSQDWRIRYDAKMAGSLSTKLEPDDAGFICDLRSQEPATPTIYWRGTPIKLSLHSTKWVRVEGKEIGNRLIVRLNDYEYPPVTLQRGGEIKVAVEGPIEVSNVYVRKQKARIGR